MDGSLFTFRAFLIPARFLPFGSARSRTDMEDDASSEDEIPSPEYHHHQQQQQPQQQHKKSLPLDHPLAQLTKMATSPSEPTAKLSRTKNGKLVNSLAMLAGREINLSGNGRFSKAEATHMAMRYLPKNDVRCLKREASRLYVGQFSADGTFFIAGYQDKRIFIFDVESNWSLHKAVVARNLKWTITDTALSPDQRFLVYASVTPIVHLVNVGKENAGIESLANVTDIHEGLQFSDESIGIWSLKFSRDGNEILAGANDCNIYVYDLNACQTTFRVEAHCDDVNAVAFADESGHIIYSGGDDDLVKVWDRRCFSSAGKAAGQLVGHLGGITFIDSRGDGRYCISNSKDQSIKLWDIRAMSSENRAYETRSWDYRYMQCPESVKNGRHPNDSSIMTYKGHGVLRTLIRCYFSPTYSTGQKYIYTGSSDGCVYIYDLVTGEIVEKLQYDHPQVLHRGEPFWKVVRDCSWHPLQPMLVSSCWNGAMVKWEYMDEVPAKPKSYLPRKVWQGDSDDDDDDDDSS